MTADKPVLWIIVCDWDKFQHYRDRDPPWIKNYTRLMSDDNYLSLTPHRCAMLHRLWLEYARSGRRLRLDIKMLTRQLGLAVKMKDLEALNQAGFLEYSLAPLHASDPLASRARTEETEIEIETPEGPNVIEDSRTNDESRYEGETDYLTIPREKPILPEHVLALTQPGVLPDKDYR